MSILNVLCFPNPKLRVIAEPVQVVDESIKTLIKDMFETMYDNQGVGLAATQVDAHQRIFVADCTSEDEASNPLTFVNPEIIKQSDEIDINQEGCLSIPENYADIARAKKVAVKALDKNGNEFVMECEGLLAICVQHEIDHLNGKLFIDYLSKTKQLLVRDKMKKHENRLVKEAKKALQTPQKS